MKDTFFVVPSRSRPKGKQLIQQLNRSDVRVRIAVPEDQYDLYTVEPENGLNLMLAVPNNIEGIAATRRHLIEFALARGLRKIVMLDDDIFFYRRKPGVVNLRDATAEDIAECFEYLSKKLDDYAHVGVGAREGHGHVKEDSILNSRYLRVLGYAADLVKRLCEFERVPVMEDFDIALQLLRKGFPSHITYEWGQGQKQTQSPGGCSDYRTHQLHEEAAHKLAELHPGFVKLRQKKNKTGGEFGNRTEVTIYWKKAYNSGLEG